MSDRCYLSQFTWGRSEPKVVRWQIKDQSCFSYPEMMFQINLCYFLCWLVSLLLSWASATIISTENTPQMCDSFKTRLLRHTWCIRIANGSAHNWVKWPGYETSAVLKKKPFEWPIGIHSFKLMQIMCFYIIDQSGLTPWIPECFSLCEDYIWYQVARIEAEINEEYVGVYHGGKHHGRYIWFH